MTLKGRFFSESCVLCGVREAWVLQECGLASLDGLSLWKELCCSHCDAGQLCVLRRRGSVCFVYPMPGNGISAFSLKKECVLLGVKGQERFGPFYICTWEGGPWSRWRAGSA